MPKVYDEEAWEQARILVVEEGEPYREVAKVTGIGISALQKRASADAWQVARGEYVKSAAAYKERVRRLKNRSLDRALDPDAGAQEIHAWLSVERAFPEHRYNTELTDAERRALVASFIERTVDFLKAHDTSAVAALSPYIRDLAEHLLSADWRA